MSFQLSKEEFSVYDLESKFEFVRVYGEKVATKYLSVDHIVTVYRLNDFYVEVLVSANDMLLLSVELIVKRRHLSQYINIKD